MHGVKPLLFASCLFRNACAAKQRPPFFRPFASAFPSTFPSRVQFFPPPAFPLRPSAASPVLHVRSVFSFVAFRFGWMHFLPFSNACPAVILVESFRALDFHGLRPFSFPPKAGDFDFSTRHLLGEFHDVRCIFPVARPDKVPPVEPALPYTWAYSCFSRFRRSLAPASRSPWISSAVHPLSTLTLLPCTELRFRAVALEGYDQNFFHLAGPDLFPTIGTFLLPFCSSWFIFPRKLHIAGTPFSPPLC